MEALRTVRGVAASRAAFGAVLTIWTEPFLRLFVRDAPPTGPLLMFARTVGIRDLVLGLGGLAASRRDGNDVERWVAISLLSDVGDAIAGATASRHIGRGKAAATAILPVPFIAAGMWALVRLRSKKNGSAIPA